MKKIYVFIVLMFFSAFAFSQAKKPSLMVVPSDDWCGQNGYMMEFDNQGKVVKVPDYKKALQENFELHSVIAKINEMMTDRGFPLEDLEQTLKSLEEAAAEDAMGDYAETPQEKLQKTAKADIWIQVSWKITQQGPKRSISFILQAKDSYTNKQVAGASGTGNPSMAAETALLLQEAVLSHIDNFNVQLQNHFDDMFENGREIQLEIKVSANWDYNLESEDFGDDELGVMIEDWISNNTVKGRFNTASASENNMVFKSVRIPLYDEKGKAMDAKSWAKKLQKYLNGLSEGAMNVKLSMKGLGKVILVMGGK